MAKSVIDQAFIDLATPGVQQLTPYPPGKPVEELERELGITNSIKLASNENPLGPSPLALHRPQATQPHTAKGSHNASSELSYI